MKHEHNTVIGTGIEGLDYILNGGFTSKRLYLVSGSPGAGKTTLGLQFLLEGAKRGERGLYITLTESKEELTIIASSHAWNLDKYPIEIVETITTEKELHRQNQYVMFDPREIELTVTTKAILAAFERITPSRVVIDSLTDLRLLSHDPLRYRHQIIALKRYFITRGATVVFLDESKSLAEALHLESLAHGVIKMAVYTPEYGRERRRLRIVKFRGSTYHCGYHDYIIANGGVKVFPRLLPREQEHKLAHGFLKSNIKALDDLLGEGIKHGTSTLFIGPSGAGKSSLAVQYAIATALQGKRVAFFAFDEGLVTIQERAASLGMPLQHYIDAGLITFQSLEPITLLPGEFNDLVRRATEGKDHYPAARTVIIDSLNSYLSSITSGSSTHSQLHELLNYLGHHGVTTILVVAQHGLLGSHSHVPSDISSLADMVFFLNNFEAVGELKKAISIAKKRYGSHHTTIHELRFDNNGLHIGQQLTQFQGIFMGIPKLTSIWPTSQGCQENG